MLGEYLGMANENENENGDNETTTETDIFKQQEKTAELLYDVIREQQKQAGKQVTTTQPTYITRVEEARPAPNYLLYIAIAVGAFLIFRT